MKNVLKKLCKKYNISALILFGSAASSRTNKLSDVDIAYLPSKKLSFRQEDALFLEVSKLLKRDDVDLVDLTKADLTLKYAIINTGQVLACTNKKHLFYFTLKTRSVYLDTQHIREIFRYYINRRILSGAFGG